MGVGVVGDELQSLGEPLFHLHFECIVGAGGIVPVVVA